MCILPQVIAKLKADVKFCGKLQDHDLGASLMDTSILSLQIILVDVSHVCNCGTSGAAGLSVLSIMQKYKTNKMLSG